MTYEIVKLNYDHKLWNKAIIKIAVRKGVITTDQYKVITNEDYTA